MNPSLASTFRISFRLLRGSCNEERVAGLLLSAKLFDSLTKECNLQASPGANASASKAACALKSDPSQALKLLGEIIDRVTPKFLVRLLCSKIELTTIGSIDTSPSNSILTFGEGGAHIRSAIVQLLEAVVRFKDGDLAQKFGPFFDRLISAYFEGKLEFDALQIVFIPSVGRSSFSKRCLSRALGDERTSSSFDFIRLFRLMERALEFMTPPKRSSLALSSIEASSLRSLIIRACGGGHGSDVRDASISLLFSCLYTLDIKWTIEMSSGNKNTNASFISKGGKENPLGSFAAFIAGLVCGEVRILYEELLGLLAATMASSESGATVSTAEERRGRSLERCEQLSTACFSIIDCIISALIGSPEDVQRQGQEEEGPAWASLPSAMLLQIQKSLRALIEGYFEFLKEVRKLCQEFDSTPEGSRTSSFMPAKKVLVAVIRRSQMSIVQIALEDPEFSALCLANIDDILFFSEVEASKFKSDGTIVLELCGVNQSTSNSSSINAIDTFQSLLPLALQAVTDSQVDIGQGSEDASDDEGAGGSTVWDDNVMALLGSGSLLSKLIVVSSDAATFVESYCKAPASSPYANDTLLEAMATGNMTAALLSQLLQLIAHTGMKNLLLEKHITSLSLDMSNMVHRVSAALKCKMPKSSALADRDIHMSFLEFRDEMKSLVDAAKQLVRQM